MYCYSLYFGPQKMKASKSTGSCIALSPRLHWNNWHAWSICSLASWQGWNSLSSKSSTERWHSVDFLPALVTWQDLAMRWTLLVCWVVQTTVPQRFRSGSVDPGARWNHQRFLFLHDHAASRSPGFLKRYSCYLWRSQGIESMHPKQFQGDLRQWRFSNPTF